MATPNAVVGDIHGPTTPQSQSFTRTEMGEMYVNPADLEPSRYHVHIYTISKREFVVQQPPAIPYLIIPACGPNEEYKKVVSIPHPFLESERHPDKNEAIIYRTVAERVAMSICNPNNTSLDQDYTAPLRTVLGAGVNLTVQGVFWSKNDPPTKEELKKAHARREAYYAQLLEQSRTLEIANPKELEQLINPDFHMAAEYYGVETGWHRKLVQKVECPNCGEMLKSPTLAYHVNSAGVICVIDEERAARALPSRAAEAAQRGDSESPARGQKK